MSLAGGGVEPAQAQVGDYTSPSTVGIWLMAVAGAERLGLIGRPEAQALLDRPRFGFGKQPAGFSSRCSSGVRSGCI